MVSPKVSKGSSSFLYKHLPMLPWVRIFLTYLEEENDWSAPVKATLVSSTHPQRSLWQFSQNLDDDNDTNMSAKKE